MEGWTPLTEPQHNDVWDRFQDHFAFRPGVSATDWTSIREPNPSITFRFDCEDARENDAYESWVFAQLREITKPETAIYALDWQHPSYWFDPHQAAAFEIPPFPDGDYCIFLTQGFSAGIFGHPWEQTICLFGDRLIAAARENRPGLLSTIHRSRGLEGMLD